MTSVILKVIKPAKAMCASIPSNRRVTLFLNGQVNTRGFPSVCLKPSRTAVLTRKLTDELEEAKAP